MRCRLCGTAGLELFYTQGNEDEFRFYRCPECRLVNYDLSGGLDQEKYERRQPDPRDDDAPLNRPQTLSWEFLRRRFPRPARLLEIGCGNGRLLHLAREAGWQVRGLELSPSLAASVSERLGVQVEVAEFPGFEPEDACRFDVVVLRHVLEHLPDGKAALQEIRGLLDEGGHAFLEFPNIEALDLRAQRWLRRTGLHRKSYPAGYVPGHANEYGRHSFQRLLDETGFQLVAWQTYSYDPIRNFVYNRWHVGDKARAIARRR
ncbi:MAG: class I SAM-dependent methyltransferase [Gemmatimonadota bacterium]